MALSGAVEEREALAREVRESAVVRFAGDSGDGIQLTGAQFTQATAAAGSDLATFPDFPAEIRAPVGTTFGVSAFQINFGSRAIKTIGDRPDVLVAFNPAALKVNAPDLADGALLILDSGSFTERNLKKAGYVADPREDGSLDRLRVVEVDITALTRNALADTGLTAREQLRCKNFTALGIVLWMFDRDRTSTVQWLERRFKDRPELGEANRKALDAGHALGETAELHQLPGYSIGHASLPAGLYRTITGHEALAFGLVDGALNAGLELIFCSYPITPASSLLHNLAKLKRFPVKTFQAEDEIAAICAAIGASYGGAIGITSSSGPGIALKSEAIGLAVMTELPLVIVNSQRAGPSTGMPTKTEQSDLYQAVLGRNGDTPVVVLAAATPADCFTMAREAVRIAVRHMTPVMLLTDGFLANASEPWLIPELADKPAFPVAFAKASTEANADPFHPYQRDDKGVRPWAKPGTPGLMHRIGGIEKQNLTGNISYDPANHQFMTDARWNKVLAVAHDTPEQEVESGPDGGRLAIVGWGSTYGPISRAVSVKQAHGMAVSHIHLRNLWPLPRNLKEMLQRFDHVLVPEMNRGQLVNILRSEYLVDAKSLAKVTGKPFTIEEIENAIDHLLETGA
ncbi:MAG: 2-oxoacid:acceptor oxidoreductase subunit alpha [Geminicoccaceae bacterium]|nr:2-oxoacid:acceptor oxidoreductase subunit alpha [Geminicoccaceae bacterium]